MHARPACGRSAVEEPTAYRRMTGSGAPLSGNSQVLKQAHDFLARQPAAAAPLQRVADHVSLAGLQLQDLLLDRACMAG